MRLPREVSLFWRLIITYLVVILVGAMTVLVASDAFAPIFLERHVRSMTTLTSHNLEPMLTDLDSGFRRALNQSLLWGVLVASLLAAAVALFGTSQVTRPLRRMQHASNRIAAGNYRERLDSQAPGEVGDLAGAFNAMAAALETSEARRVELVANVAHELRTPLSSLQGYVEGLEDRVFDLDEETLGAFRRQVTRLKHLVDDLDHLSRVESGAERIQPQVLYLGEYLREVVTANRPPFVQKQVALILEPVEPVLTVIADPDRTSQVLSNLLNNALRHTPPRGEVRLSVALGEEPGEVLVSVRDTGTGISPEALPHIFTRFYRGDPARHRSEGSGSGIGLTIAKYFVEAQGGRIGVNSTPGHGSRFWFTLPAA